MQYVQQFFYQLSDHPFGIMGMCVLAFALLNCFLGYRLMKMWIGLIGFFLGFGIGFGIAGFFTETLWILGLSGLGAGVLAVLISFKLYLAGVFVYSSIVGYIFAYGIIGQEKWWCIAISVIAALIIGFLAVTYVKPIIIVATALSGGFTAIHEIMNWLNISNPVVIYTAAAITAAVGIVVQFRLNRRK